MKAKNEELQKEYEVYKEINSKDSYSKAVIDVVEKVCEQLDLGKSPAEAEAIGIKDSGITGFMAGAMASIIAHFQVATAYKNPTISTEIG